MNPLASSKLLPISCLLGHWPHSFPRPFLNKSPLFASSRQRSALYSQFLLLDLSFRSSCTSQSRQEKNPQSDTMRLFSTVALVATISRLSSTQQIDPDSVSSSTRDQWCTSQKSQCPLICLQVYENTTTGSDPEQNDCDADTLDYSCVCANGASPNVSEYSLTIPYFECTEYNNQCVANCASGNNQCASDCRTKHPCGAQSPKRYNITTTTSSSIASATASSTGGGSQYGSFDSQGDGKSAGALAVDFGASYGLAVMVAGLFGGFALVL
ncbi:hypothetical protein HDK77DRAFT_453895 [Phyllosticta capitalensis]